MKKIFIHIVCLFIVGNAFSQGEWVSASLDNGPTPNSTGLYIRSTTEFDANKCDNIVFTVRVPITAGPAVVLTETFHSSFFSHISFAIQKLNVDDGMYYYYLVNGTGNVQTPSGYITPINTPIKILELTYGGGTTNGIVQLANIENNIPGNSFLRPQFYIQLNVGDITSQSGMFFGTAGAVPVNNQAVTGDDFVGTINSVVLPVRFTAFTVIKTGNNAALNWSVENENAGTDHYEIERSFNGINFSTIGSVLPKNNGNSLNGYASTDNNLSSLRSSGIIYYRIKQVDKDGNLAYTAIRSVKMDGKSFTASVSPNPVQTTGNVNVDIAENGPINIILTDAAGKEINKVNLDGIKGLNTYKLNMSKLAAGTYFIKIDAGTDRKTLSVIKK